MLSDIVAGKATTTNGNTRCVLMKLREGLPETEQEAFDSLMANSSARAFHLMLRREGFHIANDSVLNHMTGKCVCAN